jgi:hypothetical protein
MIPRRLVGRGCQLLLAAGLGLAAVPQAHAQTVPAGKNPDAAEAAAADANDADAKDADVKNADAKDADVKDADIENLQLDWSLLNVDASTLITTSSKARALRRRRRRAPTCGGRPGTNQMVLPRYR